MSAHAELVDRAARWLRTTRRCALVAAEPVSWKTSQIPDAIGWDASGRSVLVEAKVSRGDFLADRRKPYVLNGKVGMGVECWYFTPPGLVTPDDLPDGWGLLEEHGGRMRRMHDAIPRTAEAGAIAVAEAPLLVAIARRGVSGAGRVWTDSWRAQWTNTRAADLRTGTGGVP